MFSTQEFNTGTVLEQSYSWGALVDLTANNNMLATYDLSSDNQWVPAPGVTPHAPNTNLVPILIQASN